MAAHLARAGCLVAVGNRSHAKAEVFAKEYRVAAPADTAALARACNVIVLCVPADADVAALVDTIAANATRNTFLPFHPGAVRYYKEKGIKLDPATIPK